MALFDLIEYMDETGQEIIRRIPESGSGEFVLGSQCVVREYQTAVFFRDGKALDALGAGRHTLTTANLPILSSLFGMAFGGKSPFRAEVFFVNLREFLDQKWGTPQPIVFRDTDLGMVRLRAFGNYSMMVNNPNLFVNKIVGGQGVYTTEQISGYLRGVIISSLNDLLGENMKSILDLPAMYDEIAAATRAKVADSFAAVGLELRTFFITGITPPEEVQKMIDERTSMGVIGNMNQYMQFKAAQALGDAAKNPGGAGDATSAGMGLGAGLGMGAMMANMMGQAMQGSQGQQAQQQPQQQPVQPTPPPAATVACVSCNAQIPAGSRFCGTCGAKQGPMTCPGCNNEVTPGSKFCNNCGAKLV